MRNLTLILCSVLASFSLLGQQVQVEPMGIHLDSIIRLNRALLASQKLDDAYRIMQDAVPVAEQVAESDQKRYARYLFNFGRTYHLRQALVDARRFYSQALELQLQMEEAAVSEDLAWTYNNLASLDMSIHLYTKSEQMHKRSMELRMKYLGPDHNDYITSLNNLGVLKSRQGDYRMALKYYEQVREHRRQAVGDRHTEYAQILNNMGVVYRRMGQWDQAEKLYLEAGEIYQLIHQNDHISHANARNNLANLYMDTGRFDEAEALYKDVKEIYKRLYGEKHVSYAASMNNIGMLKKKTGNHKEAGMIFLETRAFIDSTQGPSHAYYIQATHNLGEVSEELGEFSEAIAYLEEARDLRQTNLGKDHIDYAGSMIDLSRLYETTGQIAEAKESMLEAMRILKLLVINAARHLPENEQAFFIQKFREEIDRMYDFTLKHSKQFPGLTRHCLDHTLLLKGFVQQTAVQFRRSVNAQPDMDETYLEYLFLQRALSDLYAKSVGKEVEISSLEEQITALERQMLVSMDMDASAIGVNITTDSLLVALQPGEALIEFVQFHLFDRKITDTIQYAALLMRHGDDVPALIPLCRGVDLDSRIQHTAKFPSDYVNDLYAYSARNMVSLGKRPPSLYSLIWEKIETYGLDSIHTLYLSSSGLLHRLNHAALSTSDTEIIWDHYQIYNLVSTRDIISASSTKTNSPTKTAVLLGGVDFDINELNGAPDDFENALASRDATQAANDLVYWDPLPWTSKEVAQIETILTAQGTNVDVFQGAQATESAVKEICGVHAQSPQVLHLATHGYFFPEHSELSATQTSLPAFMASEHPMIRSGLILAGGNNTWRSGADGQSPTDGMDDGILTAYEISHLNLRNTELVVLSACQTGLGDILANEGVYGLQRAFKIAGARYIMLSLWTVPDRATMTFMVEFYRNWQDKKMAIPEAFRATQRSMRDRFFNPYDWAGFILME